MHPIAAMLRRLETHERWPVYDNSIHRLGSRMCGRHRTCGEMILDVWQLKELGACFSEVANKKAKKCWYLIQKSCGLSGSSAEGDELRSHGNALGDFHADYRFERFQLA